MPNTVSAKDGIIFVALDGDQTYQAMAELGDALARLAENGVIDRILFDETAVGGIDSGARRGAGIIAKQFLYNKVALVGANPFIRALATLIAGTSKQVRQLKVFDELEEALKWLG